MPVIIPSPKERNLHLVKQVTQSSINDITKSIVEINELDAEIIQIGKIYGMSYTPAPIKLYIDSYGGQAYQCLGLLGVIDKSEVPIHTIVTGCAMSCGFLISISGHKRFCYDLSTFLYHQVSCGLYGKLADLEEEIIEIRRLQSIVETHTLSHTGLSKDQLLKSYERKTDWFINAKNALKFKIVDEIL